MSVRASLSMLLLLPWLCTLTACSERSYAVLSVLSFAGSIDGVARFRVTVALPAARDVLYYPKQPTEPLQVSPTNAITLSVEFPSSLGGKTRFGVEPLDGNGNTLGYGSAQATVGDGRFMNVTVLVGAGAVPPENTVDGGSSPLDCDPNAPATACGVGKTCGLLCNDNTPAMEMCYPGGTGQPGAACTDNADCLPGSQCFTFAPACAVKTCLRFCRDDTTCGEPNAFCNTQIPCGSTTPLFQTCSRPCDPTTASLSGCATGLACYVYAGETTDCACPGSSGAGQDCVGNADCQAGFSCAVPAGQQSGGVCRAVCSLDAPTCPLGTACRSFDNSARNLYGFCL